MDTQTLSILIGLVILVVAGGVIYLAFSQSKNKETVAKADEFLKGLSEKLIDLAIQTAETFDPSKYTDFLDFEKDVLNSIYDVSWDYIQTYIATYSDEQGNRLAAAIIKMIDKDYVINFIKDLLDGDGFFVNLNNRFSATKIEKLENVVNAEDKKLADEFSDQTKYVEDGSDDELPPAKDPEYTEEDLANLNPPSDTEEEYNENDPSMEIVDGGEIKSIKDKNGNIQYYEVKDGKRHRVSKEYAASKGVDVSNG